MAEVSVNIWKREKRMSREAIIKFQILVHCHLNSIHISDNKLECLTLLGAYGWSDLTTFSDDVTTKGLFESNYSARNTINVMEKDLGLIVKDGHYKKRIALNPSIKLQSSGNIMVDIKCIHVDGTKEG